MKIRFHGDFSFTIEGDKQTVLINPTSEAQINKKVVVSLFSNLKDNITFGDKPAIVWPGEYEYSFIAIKSIKTRGDKIAHYFELDGIRIAHLGDIKKLVSQEKLEPMMNADVLILPKITDGMSNKDLKKLAEEIDPRVVIASGEEPLFSDLFKELGAGAIQPKEELEIAQKDLPQEHTDYVYLTKV